MYPSNVCVLLNGEVSLTQQVEDVTIAAMPMFHAYGIVMYFTHALTVGFKLVVVKKFELAGYLRLVEQYTVCFSLAFVLPS